MAVTAETAWQSDWASVPPVKDDSWKENLAAFVDTHVTNKLASATVFSAPATAVKATFGKSAFKAALGTGTASSLASAFEAGALATTVTVATGAFVGTDTPATKFSAVTASALNPASIAAAKAKVLTVLNIGTTKEPDKSLFPATLREAVLLLKLDVTGSNSLSPATALAVVAGAME